MQPIKKQRMSGKIFDLIYEVWHCQFEMSAKMAKLIESIRIEIKQSENDYNQSMEFLVKKIGEIEERLAVIEKKEGEK
jgi:uncharacterized protein YaiL (DUF2058 family)